MSGVSFPPPSKDSSTDPNASLDAPYTAQPIPGNTNNTNASSSSDSIEETKESGQTSKKDEMIRNTFKNSPLIPDSEKDKIDNLSDDQIDEIMSMSHKMKDASKKSKEESEEKTKQALGTEDDTTQSTNKMTGGL